MASGLPGSSGRRVRHGPRVDIAWRSACARSAQAGRRRRAVGCVHGRWSAWSGASRTARSGVARGCHGHPILPFHIEAARSWSARSWDRTQIPRPFSTAAVSIGAPFEVPRPVGRRSHRGTQGGAGAGALGAGRPRLGAVVERRHGSCCSSLAIDSSTIRRRTVIPSSRRVPGSCRRLAGDGSSAAAR